MRKCLNYIPVNMEMTQPRSPKKLRMFCKMFVAVVIVLVCLPAELKSELDGHSKEISRISSVKNIGEFSGLTYESAHQSWGGSNFCGYSGDPTDRTATCGFGPEKMDLTYYGPCRVGFFSKLSKYLLRFKNGRIIKAEINFVDHRFDIQALREIGLEPVWPDRLTTMRGGPGQAYHWNDVGDAVLIEVHSTADLSNIDRFVIWFEAAPTMGNYPLYSRLREERKRRMDCERLMEREMVGGACF